MTRTDVYHRQDPKNEAKVFTIIQKPQHLNFINESTICKMEM
jgi:hypothetical protein